MTSFHPGEKSRSQALLSSPRLTGEQREAETDVSTRDLAKAKT